MKNQANSAAEVAKLVQAEVESFKDLVLRAKVVKCLVPPYLQIRKWGSSPCPEMPCWIVAEFEKDSFQGRGVGVAYCELGHGENGYFWNLVLLREQEYLDSGNNCCYRTLEELAVDSGYCD